MPQHTSPPNGGSTALGPSLIDHLRNLERRRTATHDAVERRLSNSIIVGIFSKPTDLWPISPYGADRFVVSVVDDATVLLPELRCCSVERHVGQRKNYDTYSWRELPASLLRDVIRACQTDSGARSEVVLLPFAPSSFSRDLSLRDVAILSAANDLPLHDALDFKPYAEKVLAQTGLKCLRWKHLFATELNSLPTETDNQLVRKAIATGGNGHFRQNALEAFKGLFPTDLISCGPFVEHLCSINVSACIFPSGATAVYPPSLQIIGDPVCSGHQFSYCGNDFTVTKLSRNDVRTIDKIVKTVASVLQKLNYIGVFGLDLLKTTDDILISELNPRFQASSMITAAIMIQLGLTDPFTDHLAAFLGIEPQERRPDLVEMVDHRIAYSQVFMYDNAFKDNGRSTAPVLPTQRPEIPAFLIDLPAIHFPTELGALLARMVFRQSTLVDGMQLSTVVQDRVRDLGNNIRTLRDSARNAN